MICIMVRIQKPWIRIVGYFETLVKIKNICSIRIFYYMPPPTYRCVGGIMF